MPGLGQAGRLGTAQLVLKAACRPAGAFPRCRPAGALRSWLAGGRDPEQTEGGLGLTFLSLWGLGVHTQALRCS